MRIHQNNMLLCKNKVGKNLPLEITLQIITSNLRERVELSKLAKKLYERPKDFRKDISTAFGI